MRSVLTQQRGNECYRSVCPACCQRRQDRRVQQRAWNCHVGEVIPPLYRRAKMGHLAANVTRLLREAKSGAVLYGPPGTGKTYAICAFARWMIVSGNQCPKRITWDHLLLKIRRSFKDESELSELDIVSPYMLTPILLLEDVGATTGLMKGESDFAARALMVILDHRLEWLLPTYITTNKTQSNLGQSFNPRIASRLAMLTWIGLGGRDQRR